MISVSAMDMPLSPLPLVERLRKCAQLWADASEATLARLGRTVINDGGFFARVEETGSTTTGTIERFAVWLIDPANWPQGEVPQEVREFGHVTGVSAPVGDASAGNGSGNSRSAAAAVR